MAPSARIPRAETTVRQRLAMVDPEKTYTANQLRVILGDDLATTVLRQAGLPAARSRQRGAAQ